MPAWALDVAGSWWQPVQENAVKSAAQALSARICGWQERQAVSWVELPEAMGKVAWWSVTRETWSSAWQRTQSLLAGEAGKSFTPACFPGKVGLPAWQAAQASVAGVRTPRSAWQLVQTAGWLAVPMGKRRAEWSPIPMEHRWTGCR